MAAIMMTRRWYGSKARRARVSVLVPHAGSPGRGIGLGSGCGQRGSVEGWGERTARPGRVVGRMSMTPNSKLRIQIESGAV
jgi:hypothetical protein